MKPAPDLVRRFQSLALATICLSSAYVLLLRYQIKDTSSFISFFYRQIVFYEPVAAPTLLLILLVSLAWPSFKLPERCARNLARHPGFASALLFLFLCGAALFINRPRVVDEFAAIYQSRLFSEGRIVARYQPELLDWLVPRDHQNVFFTVSRRTGDVISSYWPTYSLLMSPFSMVGIAWAYNPLLAAGSLLLLHRIAANLFEEDDSPGWVMLLALASPVFTAFPTSFYAANSHLFFNLLYAFMMLNPTAPRLLGAGIVGSLALTLHNPFPHILFATPWLVQLALKRGRLRNLSLIVCGYAPISLLCGVGWVLLKQMVAGQDVGAAQATLFAHQATLSTALPLSKAFALPSLASIVGRLTAMVKIILWETPGLLVLAVLGYDRRPGPTFRVMAASAFLTFSGYFFVPFDPGYGWGDRYFHSAWGVLPLIGAAAFLPLSGGAGYRRLASIVGTAALLSLALAVPLRFYQIHDFIEEQYQQLPDHDPRVAQIIFIDTRNGYYAGDFVHNDPFLRNPTLIMASHGERDDERLVRQRFPWATRRRHYRLGTVWSAGGPGEAVRP